MLCVRAHFWHHGGNEYVTQSYLYKLDVNLHLKEPMHCFNMQLKTSCMILNIALDMHASAINLKTELIMGLVDLARAIQSSWSYSSTTILCDTH